MKFFNKSVFYCNKKWHFEMSSVGSFSTGSHGSSVSPNNSMLTDVTPSEEQAEQWGNWLSEVLIENPQLLSLRERILPWTGGLSFANVVHADTMTSLSHINRYSILELIFQHLNAIGMHKTAEILEGESGYQFQKRSQPWDKTDLHLLTSAGVLPREDPWNVNEEPGHYFITESLEEDFFASPYEEDYSSIYKEILDPDLGAIYETDKNGNRVQPLVLKAASLKRLAVYLTLELDDDEQLYGFLYVIHSFTSSHHFFQHICAIFYAANAEMSDSDKEKISKMEKDNQISVINLFKKWISEHGLFIGRRTIKSIGHFYRKIIDDRVNYDYLYKYAKSGLDSLPSIGFGRKMGKLQKPSDEPLIDNPQILFRPSLKLIDPNPKEVARQITLVFYDAFKAIHSREFVVALGDREVSPKTPTLAEFRDIGRKLELLILENIAIAQDKTAAVNRVLEIAKELSDLGNYDALYWIINALLREELSFLPVMKDENVLNLISSLKSSAGYDIDSISEYLENIKLRFGGWSSTIPNIRTELLTFKSDDSPLFIDGLINLEKRRPFSNKIVVLYKFQNKPYIYHPISQIQKIILRGPNMSEEELFSKFADLHL